MKKMTLQTKFNFTKTLMIGLLLLCGFMFSSNKSAACSGTASFTYNVGVNGHYTFNGTAIGFGGWPSYAWNAGDGSGWHPGSTFFAHIFIANGTYNVQFAVNDSLCYDTVTNAVTVSNVTTPCTLSASFNVSYGAHGQATFTSTSGGVNANTLYYWAPGDSNLRYQGASVLSHTYTWNGFYTVWLTVYDTGRAYCIDSTAVTVHITNADSGCHFHPNFTYVIDTNGQVSFTGTAGGGSPYSVYSWNFGDTTGIVSGYRDSSVVHTFAYNGTYNVTLVINDSTCVDSITIPVTITNACNLNVNFTYQYDSSGQVMFTSTSTGVNVGAHYTWSLGDSTTSTGYDTVTHAYSFLGYYTVTLTIVNPGGCTLSSTQTIYIYNKDSLLARFYYTADSLNAGEYHFTSTSRGTDNFTYYKWTPGDGDPSDSGLGMTTYTHTYLHNGPYNATLTIWYTVLPHRMGSAPRYDLSSYTLVINVTGATGIASVTDSKIYNIYPNPNNGTFNISVNGLANDKNAEIRISDMMGQVIYHANTDVKGGNVLNEVNLPNAANGIYLLQIITADNTYTSRIAIQR